MHSNNGVDEEEHSHEHTHVRKSLKLSTTLSKKRVPSLHFHDKEAIIVSQISNMIMRVGNGDLERLDESVKQNPNANTPPVKKRMTPNT